MAEYLLKGAKMLSKACPACGSPLFTYKDRTFCVVCETEGEKGKGTGRKQPETAGTSAATGGKKLNGIPAPAVGGTPRMSWETSPLACALEATLITLTERIATEPDPDRCLSLMNTVKKGIEALTILSQP
jgi:UPF0148 protein